MHTTSTGAACRTIGPSDAYADAYTIRLVLAPPPLRPWQQFPRSGSRHLLYAFTVFCIAYPLRREGVKLPKGEIPAGAKRGWLTFTRMPAGQPVWTARLVSSKGAAVLPELHCARVQHVERGILIRGLLMPTPTTPVPQAWWCEPDPNPPATQPPPGTREGRRAPGQN